MILIQPPALLMSLLILNLFQPNILFNVEAINISAFNFFDTLLYQGVVFYGNGESKIIILPLAVAAKFQVLCVNNIFYRVFTTSCRKQGS